MHGFEVADLHSGSGGENVGGLSHELGRFDLGLGSNDLGFTDTLALGGHGEGLLELGAENDILYKHALYLDAPAGGNIFDDLTNRLGKLLATLDDVLKNSGANDVAESCLSTFDQGLADVGDAKGSLVGGDDVVVDDRGESEGDIVLGHAGLLGDLCYLNLDVDLNEALGERVDPGETRIDCLVETTELGNEADVALTDALIGVGAAEAARDGAEGTNARTKSIG